VKHLLTSVVREICTLRSVGAGERATAPGHPVGSQQRLSLPRSLTHLHTACYHHAMFNFGKPKTVGDWIVDVAGAIVAIFLVWWMLRMYVL